MNRKSFTYLSMVGKMAEVYQVILKLGNANGPREAAILLPRPPETFQTLFDVAQTELNDFYTSGTCREQIEGFTAIKPAGDVGVRSGCRI
jgi:hypothetical protein